jgi:hypothetical protein
MFFQFGEKVAEYDFKVINERHARASAGIMFLFGLVGLFFIFGAFGNNSLFLIELFSITFIIEFFVRVIINPKYAPFMILGSLITYNQAPEWVEAKPKQFAWSLGLLLGLIMAYYIVFDIISPIRMGICVLCLILLYLEAVFGICLGCLAYNQFNFKLKGLCPGGTCNFTPNMSFNLSKVIALIISLSLFVGIYFYLINYKYIQNGNNKNERILQHSSTKTSTKNKNGKDCTVPQFAINLGHEEIWKKHNNCE